MKKNGLIKKVKSHLKGDIKTFQKEQKEDRELIQKIENKKRSKK